MTESDYKEIFISSLKEDYLTTLLSGIPKNSIIKIRLSSSLFYFGDLDDYDTATYNKFDYSILKEGSFIFAFSRDSILHLIALCKKLKLVIREILPDFSNFSGDSTQFSHRINFLSQEYISLFEKHDMTAAFSFEKFHIKIAVISLVLPAIILIFSWSYKRKIDNLKDSISLKERFIQNYVTEFEELKKFENSKDIYASYIYNTTPKIAHILDIINKSSNKNIFYEEIEISKGRLKISGTTSSLFYLYSLEENLVKNGFFNMNNEFVKNSDNFFSFSLDCEVVSYDEKKDN